MDKKIKNGKEILDDFFIEIKKDSKIDQKIVKILDELYETNKFMDRNILSALEEIREGKGK